jgi:uncharacterized protein HemX
MNEEPEQPKTVLQHIWDIAKAIVLVGAEKIWKLTKSLAKWIAVFAATNPIPALIIGAVLIGLIILWAFWGGGESENQKKADNAAEQGITKTAEVEQQKEVSANVEERIETQNEKVKVAENNAENKRSVVKAARERVNETRKASQNASNASEKARQAVEKAKLDEVIANCEKIYERCR